MVQDILGGTLLEPWSGSRFRQWREDLRLTQAEAAHLLGVSRRSIITWEAAPADRVSNTVVLAARYILEHQDLIALTFRTAEQALVEAAADASKEVAAPTAVSKSYVAALSAAATKMDEVAEAVDKIASKPPSR